MSLMLELWYITMSEIYVVEEFTRDHYQDVGVFSSEEAATAFCETHYGSPDKAGWYYHNGYHYIIATYEISE